MQFYMVGYIDSGFSMVRIDRNPSGQYRIVKNSMHSHMVIIHTISQSVVDSRRISLTGLRACPFALSREIILLQGRGIN